MHGVAGILSTDGDTPFVPPDGWAGWRGALIPATLMKLLLMKLHLSRDRPGAHHVRKDVRRQVITLTIRHRNNKKKHVLENKSSTEELHTHLWDVPGRTSLCT